MISLKAFTEIFKKPKPLAQGQLAKFASIDASMRFPAIFFMSFAVVWLLIGTLLALIASIELHSPEFFPNLEWLTFGRVRAAHLSAMAFGWSNNAIFAIAMWVMLRLSHNELHTAWLLILAGIFWNIAIAAGVVAILAGQTTSVEWLEIPRYLSPLIAISYIMIGMWGIIAFINRKSDHVYVSQWYILGALFWFPWLYTVVQAMIFWFPARGVVQPIVNWWFGHNVLGLWYTPMSVAIAYYTIPKVLGRPIHSYYLSVVGFWTLALFYNWAGMHHLIGGPIPTWLISSSVVASVMMVIPVLVTAVNHHLTVVGYFNKVWQSPTLRFTVFGAMSYTLSSFIGSTMALREVNKITHFTHFTVAHAHHGAYAFVAMVLFGAFYYVVPRILNREWPSAALIKWHFWCTSIGITIYVVGLSIGGWIQGLEMNNPDVDFLQIVAHTVPWLFSRSVAGSLMAVGHITFFVHFVWILFSKRVHGGPTMFYKEEEVKS